MAERSLRIFCQITWPNDEVSRLWDGGGPLVDDDGEVWRGASIVEGGLDALEMAINGEASTLNLSLTGVPPEIGDLAWQSYEADDIVGGILKVMIQECGADDLPTGDRDTLFTGTIDNVQFLDHVIEEDDAPRPVSTITIEVTNRFSLRRVTSGWTLSDVDQKARSAVLNPGGNPDLFCERVPLLEDKTIVWPRWN